jgi:hypothetical protein
MPNLTEIIQQIQRDLSCPICGKNYETGEIRLRGLFDHTLIVQTICANNHVTLFMTTVKDAQKKTPISANDIIDLHKRLENFDGNFEKLWNK